MAGDIDIGVEPGPGMLATEGRTCLEQEKLHLGSPHAECKRRKAPGKPAAGDDQGRVHCSPLRSTAECADGAIP